MGMPWETKHDNVNPTEPAFLFSYQNISTTNELQRTIAFIIALIDYKQVKWSLEDTVNVLQYVEFWKNLSVTYITSSTNSYHEL